MEGRTAWNNYTFLIQQQKTYTMLISKNHFVMRMFQMKKQFFFYGNFQVTSFWKKKTQKLATLFWKQKYFVLPLILPIDRKDLEEIQDLCYRAQLSLLHLFIPKVANDIHSFIYFNTTCLTC